jgi:hypothetical protein
MRLWVLLQVVKTPSMLPAARAFIADSDDDER